MIKTAKVLYGINGITNVFIGVLHTMAHYSDLVTPLIEEKLNFTATVSGIESNVYNLWQGMSLMMGLLLITVGALHLLILFRLPKNQYPPIGASIIMILMLFAVIYAGYNFFGAWQVYGGIMGIVLQLSCLSACVIGVKRQESR